MNLAQLEHLLALAETGSFSKAADRVYLTQPALSRSIRALEEELGGRLVDRVGKSNELTALGTTVIQRARQVLAGIVELKQAARHVQAGAYGNLRIGLGAGPAGLLSDPLLAHGALNFPRVKVMIHRGRPEEQLKALRARQLDMLVIDERSVSPEQGVLIERLEDMRTGVFFRPDHPLSARPRLRFDDLLKYPIASTAIAPEVARHLLEAFGPQAHPDMLICLQSDEIGSLIEAACTTDTIFVGLRAAAAKALARGALVERELRTQLASVARFCIVTLEGREPPALLPVVRKAVRTTLKGHCAFAGAPVLERIGPAQIAADKKFWNWQNKMCRMQDRPGKNLL